MLAGDETECPYCMVEPTGAAPALAIWRWLRELLVAAVLKQSLLPLALAMVL